MPKENVINPTYATYITSWSSGSNRNINSPSISAAIIPQNNLELKERIGHTCLFESQDESDDGGRDADIIPDLPHELHA